MNGDSDAGGVMLGRLVNERLHERPPAWPKGAALPLFERAEG